MRPSAALDRHREAIRRIVASHRASNARIFGSALTGLDGDDSDLDILVDPSEDMTLFDIGAIRHELGILLGIEVDVVTPLALPQSFRDRMLAEARAV
ncbi:MAG TPA: nucleotidyltransferase domain-containing protein [Ensifer sp.]|nr:nucleotidyltransferase domain-containing protein [Ensifer sp.]